jgi:hypothetical protein
MATAIAIEQPEPPDVPTQQRAMHDLVKMIRKLHWIGLEDEARRLLILLSDVPLTDRALSVPVDTD